MTIITLTTDFGAVDGYVGAMKGVILGLARNVTLVDISHAILPQDVRQGARVLATAVPHFPPASIHVAVVDPGVGGARRGIALQTSCATFVGPDNGLFTPFLQKRVACVELTNPATHRNSISATFHGRDIFAPVAAHLASGLSLTELGPPIDDPVSLFNPQPTRLADDRLRAEVVYVDHFGNLVTNVAPEAWAKGDVDSMEIRVVVEGVVLTVRRSYAYVAKGTLLALVGSDGYLEIAVRQGNAARRLGLGVGAEVEVLGI